MRGTRQPLRQADDLLQSGLLGGDCESHCALNHVGIDGRAIIGALYVIQRTRDALDIAHFGDRNLRPLRLQPRAAAILSMHYCADGKACLQQFGKDRDDSLGGCPTREAMNHELADICDVGTALG